MRMLSIDQKGDFSKTLNFLKRAKKIDELNLFEKAGQAGVKALSEATPKNTGKTADSWYYKIVKESGRTTINWLNKNVNDGVVIAVILQYGHGTGTGGYVQGTDYVNPAIKKVFEDLVAELWKEVTR